MATITTRASKGAALSHAEMDANFTNLNNDKAESGDIITAVNAVMPVGAMCLFAGAAPAKWLESAGQSLLRVGVHATLFAYLGTTYGAVDIDHFNLPDYRGYGLRHTDGGAGADPDAGGRTDRGDGVTGDAVGTKQEDDFKSHDHTHTNTYTFQPGAGTANGGGVGQANQTLTTSATGGVETRMKNINILVCIKAEEES